MINRLQIVNMSAKGPVLWHLFSLLLMYRMTAQSHGHYTDQYSARTRKLHRKRFEAQ